MKFCHEANIMILVYTLSQPVTVSCSKQDFKDSLSLLFSTDFMRYVNKLQSFFTSHMGLFGISWPLDPNNLLTLCCCHLCLQNMDFKTKYITIIYNKKVLLRDRKMHTARVVTGVPICALSTGQTGYPISGKDNVPENRRYTPSGTEDQRPVC